MKTQRQYRRRLSNYYRHRDMLYLLNVGRISAAERDGHITGAEMVDAVVIQWMAARWRRGLIP